MPGTDAHPSADLRTLTREGVRGMLEAAFPRYHIDYDDASWVHDQELVDPDRFFGFWSDERWVATCGAFTRTLTVPGGSVPAAAVALVSVSPTHRRQGLLTRMMHHQLVDVHGRGEPVAALWASEAPIYGRFGYGSAVPRLTLSGETSRTAFVPGVRIASGRMEDAPRSTAEVAIPKLHASLLPARPGAMNREAAHWAQWFDDPADRRHGATARRFALHRDPSGTVDGYAAYRVMPGEDYAELRVEELDAASGEVRAALWRYLLDIDLVGRFTAPGALDDSLRHLVANDRLITTRMSDSLYVRLVDVEAALSARSYATELDVVIGVVDAVLPHNHRGFRLTGGPAGMVVSPSNDEPDLRLDVRELGTIYLGGVSLRDLHLAGLVEESTPGSVADTARAFAADRAPFCPDPF
jgi:predicted acetyltransferase